MSNTLRNLSMAALLVVSASAFMPGQASALSMSECSAKYKTAKAADPNTPKWNDFRKAQCSTDASAAAPAAPAATAATAKTTTTAATATTASTAGGGTFMQNCSASWKAMKAAGTTNGMSWKDFLAAKCQAPASTAVTPSGSFMQNCSASWKAMKAAGTTNGMSWKDFLAAKCQVAGAAAPAPVPATPAAMGKTKTTTAIIPPEPSDTPDNTPMATTDKNGKAYTPGQLAAHKRIKACGAQWQQLKATNKLPANIASLDTKHRWPQFWSMCNKQLKAQGQ